MNSKHNEPTSVDNAIERIIRRLKHEETVKFTGKVSIILTMKNGGIGNITYCPEIRM